MEKSTEFRLTRGIFAVCLLGTILLSFIWVLQDSARMIFTGGLVLFTLVLWFLINHLHRKGRSIDWAIGVAILSVIILVPELGLRIIHFRYVSEIQFGWPRPTAFFYIVPDEDLFWKSPSSNPIVNSWGFTGKEIEIPKPSDVYRILYLGDSCTRQGYPQSYPIFVEQLLNADYNNSSTHFESIPLAVSGYSSHQGRVLAELYAPEMQPDLVIVYFGWNDHWLAYNSIDAEKRVIVPTSTVSKTFNYLYMNSRLFQLAKRFWVKINNPTGNQPLNEVRVPPQQFRENLLGIEEVIRSENVPIIFITAPTSHYRLGVPDQLIRMTFAIEKQSIIERHKKYCQIVREVAAERGAHIIDLEAEIDSSQNIQELFFEDGIHLSETGKLFVAQRIKEYIENNVLTPDLRLTAVN